MLATRSFNHHILKELLMMPESSEISYDTDISYTLADSLAESQAAVRAQFNAAGISGNPRYNSDDYGREIAKYIAIPKNDGNGIEFEFSISALKARERKWIGPALLVKPLTNRVDISYTIKSKHSDGDLSGNITYTS